MKRHHSNEITEEEVYQFENIGEKKERTNRKKQDQYTETTVQINEKMFSVYNEIYKKNEVTYKTAINNIRKTPFTTLIKNEVIRRHDIYIDHVNKRLRLITIITKAGLNMHVLYQYLLDGVPVLRLNSAESQYFLKYAEQFIYCVYPPRPFDKIDIYCVPYYADDIEKIKALDDIKDDMLITCKIRDDTLIIKYSEIKKLYEPVLMFYYKYHIINRYKKVLVRHITIIFSVYPKKEINDIDLVREIYDSYSYNIAQQAQKIEYPQKIETNIEFQPIQSIVDQSTVIPITEQPIVERPAIIPVIERPAIIQPVTEQQSIIRQPITSQQLEQINTKAIYPWQIKYINNLIKKDR